MTIVKSPMAAWQTQSHRGQLITNGTLLILLFFLAFYYISWNTLNTPIRTSNTKSSTAEPVAAIISCSPIACPAAEKCPPPPTCPPPPPPYDPAKVAFLVETRPLPHLPALFAHMTSVIPAEWVFKFMGSQEAIDFLRSRPFISRLESRGKLEIIPLPADYSLSSRETISQMFTDPHLYADILYPAEHLLVFQPDSIFCANSPTTLNDFLEWDWIGAPWSKTATHGGNGGLSLRKVSKILEVLKQQKRQDGDGALEDLWLSERIFSLTGSKMPNANISKTFSVESVWDDRPLGYHVGWLGVHHEQIWDDQSQVDHIMGYCPEVKMILGMQLGGDKPAGIP